MQWAGLLPLVKNHQMGSRSAIGGEGEVGLRISSDRDDRRIFLIQAGIFGGIQN